MSDTKGKVPNIVAIEVIKKNGVDVEKLKELITKGVGAEFTTYYYYTILRMHCTGLDGEGIKEIVEEARIEDRNHFEAMVPRLYELGGQYKDIEICRSGVVDATFQRTGKSTTYEIHLVQNMCYTHGERYGHDIWKIIELYIDQDHARRN